MRAPWQRTATTEQRGGLTMQELAVVVIVLIVALVIAVPLLLSR
jgi:hypothetical protein